MDERKGKISASGFSRVAICPKSWQLSKGLPSEDTADSTRGTKLHSFCEQILNGKEFDLGDTPQEDIDAVKWCVKKVKEIAFDAKIETELRLWIGDLISGQIDVLITDGDLATIIDYKFGVNPVDEAEHNFQLMIYALLVLANFPQVEEVEVGILAPCVFGNKEPPTATYYRSKYDELLAKVKAVIARAESVDAPYCKDIGSHCQYCRARAICEKQKQNVEVVCGESELANKSFEITSDNVQTLAKQVKDWTKRMNEAQKTVNAIKDGVIKFALENPDCGVELKKGAKKKNI